MGVVIIMHAGSVSVQSKGHKGSLHTTHIFLLSRPRNLSNALTVLIIPHTRKRRHKRTEFISKRERVMMKKSHLVVARCHAERTENLEYQCSSDPKRVIQFLFQDCSLFDTFRHRGGRTKMKRGPRNPAQNQIRGIVHPP